MESSGHKMSHRKRRVGTPSQKLGYRVLTVGLGQMAVDLLLKLCIAAETLEAGTYLNRPGTQRSRVDVGLRLPLTAGGRDPASLQL
jgi:hypothetical protein